MDKTKRFLKDLSLRKSIVLYAVVFIVMDLALMALVSYICSASIENIRNSYPKEEKKFYLTTENGERLGNGTYIGSSYILTEMDQEIVDILEIFPFISLTMFSVICVIAASFLFYRNKLKEPLTVLKSASEKILVTDLDFSITFESADELGQLCSSFELMRSTLANNFSEMWRQIEERRQVNAAFAHDLRTPLTVLKGYNEMLRSSNDISTASIAKTMEKHIGLLEKYVDTMSRLKSMEDIKPEYKSVYMPNFINSLCQSASIICAEAHKQLSVENYVSSDTLIFDTDFVSQVFSNLISNATRYANCSVQLCIEEMDNFFILSVTDDGPGFSKEALKNGDKPYFTETNRQSEHFGLGLYICRLLCQSHGGYLKFENTDTTGAKVSAFLLCR
ncbi:signal transduction histidine-protein kinase BaeS [Clostridiales bacterium]|nr:signal transduction histidine-protein kinase BaeS [Clostridiales bacterium]